MNIFDDFVNDLNKAHQDVEPEKWEEIESIFEQAKAHYGDLVIKITDPLDLPLSLAAMQQDYRSVIKLSLNTAFNAFLRCYLMLKSIDPEAVAEMDRRDPFKFHEDTMTWDE